MSAKTQKSSASAFSLPIGEQEKTDFANAATPVTRGELLPTRQATLGLQSEKPVLRSVYESQDSILAAIQQLHCPEGFEADLTYGNGQFWNEIEPPRYRFDLTPLQPGVVQADSRSLPLAPGSLSNAIFDPPFLTYVKHGRDHKEGKVTLTARFGGYYTYDELEEHYRDTLSECYRVLKPNGKLIFKCQDIVHNHKLHCTHARVIWMAEIEGFRLADLFILPARHRMPSPQKGTQRHARIFHSYFLVLERDGGKHGN